MSKRIRRTDELPDDEGVVLVTDIPGSWFQILGRRAYGELFVGEFIMTPKGDRQTPAEAVGDLVEIQRGPEAESLLKLADELYGEEICRRALANGIEPARLRGGKTR
jgi:hypothetical protein